MVKSIDALDMQKNEVQNLRLQNLGADISSPVNGLIYYSTAGTPHIRAYINGSWEDIPRTSEILSATIVDVKGDLIVATAADTISRLAAGSNGTALIADSSQTTGLIWRNLTEADITVSTTDVLVGRDTAAGGVAEEIAVGGGIEFTGAGAIRTTAFTGDVTKTAGGTALTIPNDTVTYAKLQNVSATDRLLGRDTAAAGDVEELTVGGGVEFTGSGGIQRSTISGDIDIAAGSGTAAIAAGVIVNADVNAAAGIVVTKLASSATDRLFGRDTAAAGAGEEITVGGGIEFTGSGGIQRSALTGDVTATAGSNTTAIAAGVIVDADVNASAGIAATKLSVTATDKILGRDSASGGAVEELNVSGGLEFSGAGGIQRSALTGDITATAGSNTTAIAAGVIVDADVNASAAIAATKLAFTPAQGIAATTVQAAIEEAVTDLTALINSNVQGQKFKDPVDAHLSTALPNTPTYSSGAGTLTAGANAAFPTVDTTVTAVAGQDYLITGQASTFQNGIYTLTTLGSGAAPWVLTRRSDADAFTELQDAAVMVEAGTNHQGTIWTQVNAIADLTAATQSWIETNRNEVYTADGTTLTLSANQFSITTGGVSNAQVNAAAAIAYSKLALTNSVVNADIAAAAAIAYSKLALTGSIVNADISASAAIAYSKLNLAGSIVNADINASAAIAYSKLALSNSIVNADINASAAIAYSKLNLASSVTAADINGTAVASGSGTVRVARSFAIAITGGATSEVITHGLGTRNVVVSLVNPSTPWDHVMFTVESTSTTTVTIRSSGNLPAGYLLTVVG